MLSHDGEEELATGFDPSPTNYSPLISRYEVISVKGKAVDESNR